MKDRERNQQGPQRGPADGLGASSRPAPTDEQRRLLAFLRKLPHDFANAILPFRIAGDLLRRAGGDAAILEQVSRILEDQSQLAQHLVDDLDRTVRVLLGEIPTRPRSCDLEQVVAQGIAAARRHAPPSVEIALTAQRAPIEIEADPAQIAAAVEELVDNAARFAGGRPISVELAQEDGAALVRVRDGGPGIAPDRLDQIFDPFVAAETVDSGWGIGLGFVRLVATSHGGSITAAPGNDGHGLVMTLRLPRR
jgi:signal transduction histidine kinase